MLRPDREMVGDGLDPVERHNSPDGVVDPEAGHRLPATITVSYDATTKFGSSDRPFNGFSQATVSVIVDESRATCDALEPGLRLVDVARVAAMNGPQGPLYGTGRWAASIAS